MNATLNAIGSKIKSAADKVKVTATNAYNAVPRSALIGGGVALAAVGGVVLENKFGVVEKTASGMASALSAVGNLFGKSAEAVADVASEAAAS